MKKGNKKFIQADIQLSNPRKIGYDFTNVEMAKDLIALVPINVKDSVLDPSAGKNKVFYKNFDIMNKDYCEIEAGKDFMDYDKKIDWIVGNPPFHLWWKFFEKSMEVANKGFAFLLNSNRFTSLTPKRLDELSDNGFFLNRIHIITDKRWFGRYYFLIFTRERNNLITWKRKTY